MKKKIVTFIVIFMVVFCNAAESFAVTIEGISSTEFPNVIAEAAVLMDAKSGEILYEKNADDIKEMASTTKIMTAIVALEVLSLDTIVRADSEAASVGGASIGLQVGEQMSVNELLYALFLKSANDSAVVLAKAAGGTTENFVNMMNEKAREMGLENTNFKNPHGLHADGHYTSARDLAVISKEAMKNDVISNCAVTVYHTIPKTNLSDERQLKNINHLLYDDKKVDVNGTLRNLKYKGAKGLKTGYTSEAKHCIVAVSQRKAGEYIAVVLGSTKDGKYSDSIALLDWGFENFKAVKIMDSDSGSTIKVKMGVKEKIKAVFSDDVYISIPKIADESKIQYGMEKFGDVKAPIEKNDHIADLNIYYLGILVKKVPAYAKESDARGGILSFLRGFLVMQVMVVAAVLLVSAILIKIYITINKRNKIKKEEERQRKALEIEMERVERNMRRFSRYK
ncbi:MAG: D-alanyl-D-alanine carboxypeptidase family protein [Eubacteriales bacterium]